MPMNVIVIFIFHNNMCVGYARPLHIMCVNLRCKARPLETALNVNQAKDKHSYSVVVDVLTQQYRRIYTIDIFQ